MLTRGRCLAKYGNPYILNILREAGLEDERGFKTGVRCMNNPCCVDDTTLFAKAAKDLQASVMKSQGVQ